MLIILLLSTKFFSGEIFSEEASDVNGRGLRSKHVLDGHHKKFPLLQPFSKNPKVLHRKTLIWILIWYKTLRVYLE